MSFNNIELSVAGPAIWAAKVKHNSSPYVCCCSCTTTQLNGQGVGVGAQKGRTGASLSGLSTKLPIGDCHDK